MTWDLKELRSQPQNEADPLHECATCRHKERVYVKTPDGRQYAAIWRCRVLTEKTRDEVLVQPHENCYEHRSLSDHWEKSDDLALVR